MASIYTVLPAEQDVSEHQDAPRGRACDFPTLGESLGKTPVWVKQAEQGVSPPFLDLSKQDDHSKRDRKHVDHSPEEDCTGKSAKQLRFCSGDLGSSKQELPVSEDKLLEDLTDFFDGNNETFVTKTPHSVVEAPIIPPLPNGDSKQSDEDDSVVFVSEGKADNAGKPDDADAADAADNAGNGDGGNDGAAGNADDGTGEQGDDGDDKPDDGDLAGNGDGGNDGAAGNADDGDDDKPDDGDLAGKKGIQVDEEDRQLQKKYSALIKKINDEKANVEEKRFAAKKAQEMAVNVRLTMRACFQPNIANPGEVSEEEAIKDITVQYKVSESKVRVYEDYMDWRKDEEGVESATATVGFTSSGMTIKSISVSRIEGHAVLRKTSDAVNSIRGHTRRSLTDHVQQIAHGLTCGFWNGAIHRWRCPSSSDEHHSSPSG